MALRLFRLARGPYAERPSWYSRRIPPRVELADRLTMGLGAAVDVRPAIAGRVPDLAIRTALALATVLYSLFIAIRH